MSGAHEHEDQWDRIERLTKAESEARSELSALRATLGASQLRLDVVESRLAQLEGAEPPEDPPPPADPPPSTGTVRFRPGDDINLEAYETGTRFEFAPGAYRGFCLEPRNGDTLIGYGAVLDGTGADKPWAIFGSADYVTIEGLEVTNYRKPIWGPNAVRHQGAIDARAFDGANQPVAWGKGWIINRVDAHSNEGAGIWLGDYTTVGHCHLHHNGMAGLNGGDMYGGTVHDCHIWGNNHLELSPATGDYDFAAGRMFSGAWNAAGMKFGYVNSPPGRIPPPAIPRLVIVDNYVHDNRGYGIWVDVDSTHVLIRGNRVCRNHAFNGWGCGVFYEISSHGEIEDNIVWDHARPGSNFLDPMELEIWSSHTVNVKRNHFLVTGSNLWVNHARPRREYNKLFALRNITYADNEIWWDPRSMEAPRFAAFSDHGLAAEPDIPAMYFDGEVRSSGTKWYLPHGTEVPFFEGPAFYRHVAPPYGMDTWQDWMAGTGDTQWDVSTLKDWERQAEELFAIPPRPELVPPS